MVELTGLSLHWQLHKNARIQPILFSTGTRFINAGLWGLRPRGASRPGAGGPRRGARMGQLAGDYGRGKRGAAPLREAVSVAVQAAR